MTHLHGTLLVNWWPEYSTKQQPNQHLALYKPDHQLPDRSFSFQAIVFTLSRKKRLELGPTGQTV